MPVPHRVKCAGAYYQNNYLGYKPFVAQIRFTREEMLHLGNFGTAEEAAQAFDRAVERAAIAHDVRGFISEAATCRAL